MKYCTKCGQQIDGAEYCTKCGKENNKANQFNYETENKDKNYNGVSSSIGTVWFVLSLISTLCCGGVFGVLPLIFSIRAMIFYNDGDYEKANNETTIAKILFIIFMTMFFMFSILTYLYLILIY